VIFGEQNLRHLIEQFIEHYLIERHRQGIGSQIIKPKTSPSNDNVMAGPIECRSRLGESTGATPVVEVALDLGGREIADPETLEHLLDEPRSRTPHELEAHHRVRLT
jgi:hypothetical protein